MTYEALEQVPAIILHGDAIQAMDDSRRQEVAASLKTLLGVEATIGSVGIELLGSDSDSEDDASDSETTDEPVDVVPPFTLLVRGDWSSESGRDEYIAAANARAPGLIADEILARKALLAVMRHGQRYGDSPRVLTYHFGEATAIHDRPLRAITFDNPQIIFSNPQEVGRLINNLGPKTTIALGQFVKAVTAATYE